MRQTEEKQFNHERKKLSKKGLAILLIALLAVIALAVILCAKPISEKLFKCENHIDANLDLICDECKEKIPCLDGEIHADVNNDLLCDNCGAGIASSDVSVYKEIESGEYGEKTVNVRGNMPTDTKVAMKEISHDEAISLAQKFMDVESKDVIDAYDISLSNNENIKYQPVDDGENVKVTISNLNIDPSQGLAMMHIIDENNYEVIPLNKRTSTEVEFTTNRFSTYILVDFGTSSITFTGLGTYTVLNSDNVPLVSGVTVTNNTNFEFKILPLDNYVLGDIIIAGAGGATISKTAYGAGYAYVISEVTSNITVSVTNTISLTNPIKLTALTDGAWTNKDVVVEIDWPVTSFRNQIKIDNGEWQDYNEPTYTMTSSGTLYARVFDGDQGGGEVSVAVNNIDKEAPVVRLYQKTDGYVKTATIYMDATEVGSGLYGYASSVWGYSHCTSFTTKDKNLFVISEREIATDNDNAGLYIKVKDLAGNEGRAYLDITNVDKGTPIISDGTTYSDALYTQYKTYGTALSSYSDAMFANGNGGISKYAAPSKFTLTRMTYAAAGIEKWSGTTSNYVIKMSSQGTDSSGRLGGWHQSFRPQPGGYYLHRFVAKVPVGYKFTETANSWSGSGRWLTSRDGTGDWYEYIYIYDMAETGTFMAVSYDYLTGDPGTEAEPLEWYLAYNTVYNLTHLWDDIDVTYNEDASATLNIRASDGFSGIKSITVNDAAIDFKEVTAGSNKVVTADYKITAPGEYKVTVTDNAGNTTSMTKTAYQITYNGNGADGGSTANQIKIKNAGTARESYYDQSSSKINKSIVLRQNGYTNSNGLAFQGWGTNTDEIVEYMAGSRYYGTGDITLYAVWNDGIVWDVSNSSSDNVRAKVSEITPGSNTYQLTIYGTGKMKSWSLTQANAGALPWNSYRNKIVKVVVEEGVTNLGGYTLWGMNSLTSFENISFPSTLTRFEGGSIRECPNLRGTLNISKNVTYIGTMYYVPVTRFEVAADNPNYKSVDGVLYNKTMTTLVMYPIGSSETTYVIPDTVTTVGSEAMERSNVTNITIPESVTTIGNWAFGTSKFKNLYLHKGITNFPSGVFTSLSNVDSVYIHAQDITVNTNSFTNAKTGSKIYTVSKSVADKFKAGTHYTSPNTTIYYPPYFSSHPTSRSAGEGTTTTFKVTAQNGVAVGTLTYQWQYRENASEDWKNVTSTQGTGGNSSSFTTVALTPEMNGYQFRCKLANGIYPNAQITEEEIANSVISSAATLTVIQANYYFNGKYYETLADAYPDVKLYFSDTVEGVREATITVNKDCVDASDFSHTYKTNKNKLTIDTNGHTLTKTTYPIKNNGPLFITGSGTITSSSTSTTANIDTVIQNNGTLTINGATIRHRGMVSSNYMAIHNATAGATTTVNSGTVAEEYGLEVSGTGSGRAIYSNVASTITVNGGTVTSRTNRTGCSAIEAYGPEKTTIYTYGGTVSSLYTTAIYITAGSTSSATASLIQAEGGTIDGKIYGINYDMSCTSPLRVNGATVTGGTSGVINNSSNSEILIMSGTVDGDNVAITNAIIGPVSIKGGTIKGKTGILNSRLGKVTIYTGTIDSTEYGIHNAGAGEIRIENGSIAANVAAVYNSSTGTINVLGGTITAGVRGVLDAGSGTINIGTKDGAISVTTPVVQGEAYGVYGESTSIINFYDGKIKGKATNPIAKNGSDEPIDDSEIGYSLFRTKEGEYTAATLQSGWDISANSIGGTTAWAVLEQDANDMNKYKLIITATPNTSGAMKDFTTTDMPWLGYMHLIATVDIQDGISNLGSNMLNGAESLVDLTIPDSITKIGIHALKDCSSISGTFTIPSGVTTIGTNPFTNATFENFALASGNTSFVVENNLLMNATKTEIIAYPAGSATESVVIPNTVTTIDKYAFYNSQLVNVTIPASVTKIENYAFALSSKITDVTIPSSVTAIGNFAFSNMTSLGNVYLKATTPAIGSNAFNGMIGIIHTASYDIGRNLRLSRGVTVYYPPKITVHPYTQELVCPDPGTFTVTVQNGNPTGITYQWYIKEPGAADWRAVTSSDGTGGTTNTFTTGNTTPEMLSTEYRCIVSSAQYPNDNFTRAEIEADTVSKSASLTITGGNFQVDGGLYYPTLQAALEGAGSGTHTISVVTDITDDSAPVIAADQVITLDMKNKTVTKTVAGITNNGTLTIKNGGTIETINNASSKYRWLILNNGTLNLQSSTLRHNGAWDRTVHVLWNYGTFNMTSGTIEVRLNSAIASTTQYVARAITNFEGIVNISGGTVSTNYNPTAANVVVDEKEIAYAIECHPSDINAEAQGKINISGNANITSNGHGLVLSGGGAKHDIKITGGTITSDGYGIWAFGISEGSIEITGGTITSDDTAIMIESTNAIPVTISNATITSNKGNGIETNVDGSSVTIGTNAVITAAQDGVLFYTDGTNTYTQTAGRVTGGTNGVKFDSYNDDDDARINITGGTIVGTNGNGIEATYNISNVDATFSNATITGANRAINIEASQSNTAITNGTYRTTGTTGISEYGVYIYAFGDLVLTIGETGKTGPTISSGYVGVYIEGNYVANVQVNSASINAKEGIKTAGCASSDLLNANLTVNNATITGTDKAINATGLYTVNINGGNFTGNTCILNLEDDIDLTISGGTFNGQNTGIIATDLTTVTMKDGTIDTLIDGIVSDSRASIIIESGKIYAGQYGIHHKGDASYLTIGVDDATEWVSKVLPEIRATVAVKAPNGFKFYDGILKGITTPNEGDAIDWPDKYGLYTGTETIDSKTYKTLYIAMGWNISADPNVDNVWAFLEKTETGRTLTVEGTGSIKSYSYKDEAYSNIPWSDYFAEIDKLIIEPGISSIGTRVFAKLDGITTITIPEGVTKIDNYAFTKGAGKGKTVSISSTVTSIGPNPFAATNVTTIKVASGNSFFKVIDNVLYSADGTKLVSYSIGKTDTTFVVPESVTQILIQALRTANNLEKVVIGSNVTTINKETFLGSANLKEVYIESNKVETVGNNAFNDLSSNSIIYTKSKAIADLFVADTNYTSANTKIYYPPVINTQPVSQTITEGNSVTFSVDTTAGNPSAMTYTWQYKTATGSWTNATATQGTGYNTNTFTIANVTSALDGNEYRCVISTVGYPNEEMTSEELGLTSNVAVLSVNAPNYQVGSKYYNTLKEAVESITTTAETRIEVLLSNTEEDAVTIGATQNIVLDLNDKTISVKDLKDVSANAFIDNEGTLRIQGEGSIIKVNETRENKCCIINNSSLLNIDSGTYKIENAYTQKYARIAAIYNNSQNSVTNINGGEIISTNNYMGDSVGIRVEVGKLNVYDGKIYSSKMGISNNGAESSNAEINIYGGEIEGATHGIYVLLLDSATDTNMAKITVTGTPVIKGGTFGIYNQVSTSDVIITGGTMIGGVNGVHNEISTTIIGTSGDGVSTNSPVLIGDAYGINSLAKSTKFYDGILKGKRATVFGGDIITEAGYGLQYGTEGEYTTAILSTTNYTDGKSYYSSLQNAFEKAPSGATIKPTKDQTDNIKATLPAGKTMTLDLDGKTLTRADASIVNNGTFTITGNGSLNVTVFSNEARDFIKNSGVLNITGGNIQIDNICTTQERYMNLINSETSNSTINITGGNITAQNDYAGWAAIVFWGEGSVNISGGTLTSSRHILALNGANDGAKINITGGEMYAGKHVIRLSKDSNTYPDINVEVKISGTAKLESTDSVITNYSSLTDIIITGGTITSPTAHSAIYNTKSKTIIGTQGGGVSTTSPVITGGNYAVNSSKGITFYDGILKGKTATHNGLLTPESGYGVQYGVDGNYKTAILVGANYYDGTSYYATLNDAFNMAASGATITVEKNLTDSVAATMRSGKNMLLDLNGKTLTRTAATINNGTLTITDSTTTPGSITSTSTLDAIITNAGYLNIEKVTINANSTNIPSAINVTGGHVYFVSGNIYSKTIGIKSAAGTSMNLGNNSDAVSTTVPMIQADGLAISSNTFNWYDGILKSKVESVYTGTTTEATHYSPDYGTETIGGVTYNTAWLARDQNYEINGNYYATLADVIAKETGGTIKLLRKCVDDSQAIFPAGRSFVLNLSNLNMEKNIYPIVNNGTLEITGDGRMLGLALEDGMIRNNGTLTLSGSITINSSDDSATYLKLILNAGTLNITGDVLVESTVRMHSGIYQTAGTTNMESGTVSVVDIDAGTFNMNGGIITYNALRFMPVGDNSVTIAAGATFNFNGGIVKANEAAPFVNNGTLQAPENHAIYYYTDGSYKCARVELGWDISENQDGSIIGYLVPNGDNYTLEVIGSGATKSYKWNEEQPWHKYKENIAELTISEGITKIRPYVFDGLTKIKEVVLPDSLINIGIASFNNCASLTETITIPANVKTMSGNPFPRVPITNMIVAEGNTYFKVSGDMLMSMDGTSVITYFAGKTDKIVTVPRGVTTLTHSSFCGLKAEKIVLPTTLTTIRGNAFIGSKLQEIVIPASVTNIADNFVQSSTDLANIYFLGTIFEFEGNGQFNRIKSNSAIYTRSAAVASKFVDGTHYDSSLTTVYYPPVVGGTLLDTTVNSMKTVTFEVTVTPGVPNSVKYNWQVKRANTTEWVGLIDGQGLGTSEYTTTQLTVNNSGDEYRCIINGMNGTNEVYPNTYMPITDSDMTEKLISDTAKVYVRAANYLVNEEYFETLEDAVAAVPAGTATTIKLLTNLDDNSSVTIPADRNVTLDIQSFTLNREDEKITNNGTLNIAGTGTLKVESATLIDNKGTLKITQDAINIVSSASAVAIINSGSVELNKLSLTTAYTALQNTSGTVKVNGGTIIVDGKANVTELSGWLIEGGTVEILGGTLDINNTKGTVINLDVKSGATLNVAAGLIVSNNTAIRNNGGTVTITGGEISANDKGIENLGTSGNVTIGSNDGSVYDDTVMITGKNYGYYSDTSAQLSFFDGTIKGKPTAIYRTNKTKPIITPNEYDINYAQPAYYYEIATLVRANYKCLGSWFATLADLVTEINSRSELWIGDIDVYAGENFATIVDTKEVDLRALPVETSDVALVLYLKNGVAIDFEKQITIGSDISFKILNEGALGTINATVVNNGTLDLKANLTGTLTNNGTATIGATSGTLVNTVSGSITNTGAMTINKTTVTGSVTSSGSALTLNGAKIVSGVTLSNGCKFTMTAGEVYRSNGTALTNSGTGAIEVLGGVIEGTTYGINNTGTGTITIGSLTNGVISSGDPIITGGTYGVKTSANFNFYDGMLRGKTGSYQGTVTAVEEGTHIKKDTPEGNGTDYHRAYIESNDVFVEVWDISKTAGTDEVYAGVKVVKGDGVNADTRYKLVVWGTGATKDYTATWVGYYKGDAPWLADEYRTKIVSLQLEEGVKDYGDNLFVELSNVSSLTLPESLEKIGVMTFFCMKSLTGTVNIPKNMTTFASGNPFAYSNITLFTVDPNNTALYAENGIIYKANHDLWCYPTGSQEKNIVIKEETTKIGSVAFGGAKNIEEVYLHENVRAINFGAFKDASNLKKVYIKNTNESIFIDETGTFAYIAPDSIIYTESKEIADKFISDKTYTTANTSIYYPFKVLAMPDDFAGKINEAMEIAPNIRPGNPTNDVVYQWYLNGNPIAGANSATYTKPTVEDSDSGDYQVLIKSVLQEDGTYYYSHMSEKTHLRVRDHVGPENVSIAVTYRDDANGVGYAQVTVTASDTYSGVDKFYVNDVELTSGVTITNDGTGLTGGSGVAVFDIKTKGEYRISVADAEDNRTNRTTNAYLIEYLPGSDYQVTGDTKSQIVIKDHVIMLRDCGYAKAGHTFTGWKDDTGDSYPLSMIGDIQWDIERNTIMTAQWQINTYTVEFYNDAGEGPVLVERKQYNYEEIIDVPELQYHVAEMVGTDQYKIYRHKNNWKATTLDNQSVFKAENITADNINSIWMVDSNVRYDATYTVTTYDIGNATVYLDGNMSVSGTNAAIQNDEGVIFIGPLPTIYGPVYNNNGLIFDNR